MFIAECLRQDDETVSDEEKADVMRLMTASQFPSSVGTVEIVSGNGHVLCRVGFRSNQCYLLCAGL